MRWARVRLIVAATLFVGWLGYLGYLALGHTQPMVVSRSQLMNATSSPTLSVISGSWVVAEVEMDEAGKPQKTVRIRQVYAGEPIVPESINVANLPEARLPPNKPVPGNGLYLIPLFGTTGGSRYTIASTRWAGMEETSRGPLIYPWNAEVESQLKQLTPTTK